MDTQWANNTKLMRTCIHRPGVRMYTSKIVEATDPDLFVASIRPTGIDFTVTERGPFAARTLLFDMGRVYGQRASEKLARCKYVETPRAGVLFLTKPGPSMFLNGAEIGINQIGVVGAGESYISRLLGETQWGVVSLTKEDMDTLFMQDAGFRAHRVSGATVITPPPEALTRLRWLHSHLDCLATTSKFLTDTDLTHNLESRLIEAMREILGMQVGRDTAGRCHHQLVVNRFRAIVGSQADTQLHMTAISQKIGTSGRTLRLACREQLGVSPGQYLMLRRLRAARRALRKADPHIARVTDIATEHGFWELGRFAVQYRQVFGESPSATLRAVA